MARIKGSQKTGGRKKGSPNRATTDLRAWVRQLIDDNRNVVEADLKQLDPDKRLMILERMMQYCIPKQQSVNIEAQIAAEYDNLRNLLETAPDKVVNELEQRIITLKSLTDGQTAKN